MHCLAPIRGSSIRRSRDPVVGRDHGASSTFWPQRFGRHPPRRDRPPAYRNLAGPGFAAARVPWHCRYRPLASVPAPLQSLTRPAPARPDVLGEPAPAAALRLTGPAICYFSFLTFFVILSVQFWPILFRPARPRGRCGRNEKERERDGADLTSSDADGRARSNAAHAAATEEDGGSDAERDDCRPRWI